MIQKLKSRKSRIKPGLFDFLLAERIIFGKKTQKSQVSLVRYLTFFVSVQYFIFSASAGHAAVTEWGRSWGLGGNPSTSILAGAIRLKSQNMYMFALLANL